MSPPLDEQYLTWLYSQVGSVKQKNKARTHWALMRQLYTKEFVWLIANDDNRLEDGRDLRYEFAESSDINISDIAPNWLGLGCSMLELLIALSRRLSFEAEGEPLVWFWHLVEQLDLEQYNDRNYDDHAAATIDQTLDRVIWRRYAPNGEGGLFPLRCPERDQREVELWYQLNAYLLEQL